MKKLNQKGFTLAELLIVVAIIAVLVAIAIPVFGRQLEKSRETTDAANLRSAYAAAAIAVLDVTTKDGGVSAGPVAIKQTQDGFEYIDEKIGNIELLASKTTSNDLKTVGSIKSYYVNVATSGTVTITQAASFASNIINPLTGTKS